MLLEACCRGDDGAWVAFVTRFNASVARYALRACRTLADQTGKSECVYELVQDVYLRLVERDFKALRSWRGADEASFLAYLARITAGIACDKLRQRRSRKRACLLVSLNAPIPGGEALLQDIIPDSAASRPDVSVLSRLEEERVLRALAEVCSGEKGRRNSLIFQLHVLEGFSASEISRMAAFDLTAPNVETIIRRTRERVLPLLQPAVE